MEGVSAHPRNPPLHHPTFYLWKWWSVWLQDFTGVLTEVHFSFILTVNLHKQFSHRLLDFVVVYLHKSIPPSLPFTYMKDGATDFWFCISVLTEVHQSIIPTFYLRKWQRDGLLTQAEFFWGGCTSSPWCMLDVPIPLHRLSHGLFGWQTALCIFYVFWYISLSDLSLQKNRPRRRSLFLLDSYVKIWENFAAL